MELLGDDREHFSAVMRELNQLRRYGVELTPERVALAVDTIRKCHVPQPAPHPVQLPPTRDAAMSRWRSRGRFSQVPDVGSVVYYMRIGNRVKIGTSTNLRDRLEAINPEELLALEAGDARLERRRHRQFAALRTHGEWFRLEGALRDHIEALRAAA